MSTPTKQMPVFLLDRGDDAPTCGVDILGGRPPGVTADRWPRGPDGTPMQHVATIRTLGRIPSLDPAIHAVAVFVPRIDEAPFDPRDPNAVIALSASDLSTVPTDQPPCPLLACAHLEVTPYGILQGNDTTARFDFDASITDNNDPLEQPRERQPLDNDLAEILLSTFEDQGHISYLGGLGVISSSWGPRENDTTGPFVMRLSQYLFEEDGANFAGDGYLFVCLNVAWAEQ